MITFNSIAIALISLISIPLIGMEPAVNQLQKKRKKIVRFQSEPEIIRSPLHTRRTSAPEHVLLSSQEIQTIKESILKEKIHQEHLKEFSKKLKLANKSKSTKTKVVKDGVKTIYYHDKKGLISSFYAKINLATPDDSKLNKNTHPEIRKLVEKHEAFISTFAKDKGALINKE